MDSIRAFLILVSCSSRSRCGISRPRGFKRGLRIDAAGVQHRDQCMPHRIFIEVEGFG